MGKGLSGTASSAASTAIPRDTVDSIQGQNAVNYFFSMSHYVRDVSELPSNAEIFQTMDLVEARNERIQALQDRSDAIQTTLSQKLQESEALR
jgi:hypothetical protein